MEVADPVITTAIPQAQSSIELQRHKDYYGWTIKKYTDSELPDLDEINRYDDELKRRFVAGPAERSTP